MFWIVYIYISLHYRFGHILVIEYAFSLLSWTEKDWRLYTYNELIFTQKSCMAIFSHLIAPEIFDFLNRREVSVAEKMAEIRDSEDPAISVLTKKRAGKVYAALTTFCVLLRNHTIIFALNKILEQIRMFERLHTSQTFKDQIVR